MRLTDAAGVIYDCTQLTSVDLDVRLGYGWKFMPPPPGVTPLTYSRGSWVVKRSDAPYAGMMTADEFAALRQGLK